MALSLFAGSHTEWSYAVSEQMIDQGSNTDKRTYLMMEVAPTGTAVW